MIAVHAGARPTRGRRALGLLVSVILLLAATGGAGRAQTDTTLRFAWWGGDTRHALTNATVDLFLTHHPGVTINREPTDWDSYWDRLAVAAAGGDVPDILNMHVQNIVQYAHEGVLAPLDPLIEAGTIDVSGLSEGFLAGGKVDGMQYMIPMGSPYMGTVYDADALAAAGLQAPGVDYTWDEFFQFLKDWAAATGGQAPWPSLNMAGSEQHFYSWLLGQGIPVFTAEGKVGFTQDDLARWYTAWSEVQAVGGTPPTDVQVEEDSTTPDDGMMAKGRVSMEPRPSNQLGTFETLLDAKVDVIGLPAGPAGPGNVMLPAGLALYADSPYQEIGGQFLSFWVNDTEAAVTYKADQGVPGVAAQRDALLASPEMPSSQRRVFELFGQLSFASMSPLPANVAEFITIFQAGYQPVGFGTSPADAAAQVFTQLPASFK